MCALELWVVDYVDPEGCTTTCTIRTPGEPNLRNSQCVQVSQDCNSEPGPADIVLLNQIGQGTSVNTRIGMR